MDDPYSDVFLVYKTDADDNIAKKICSCLEGNSLKVAVQWKPCCFNPGVPTFYSIVECVNNSKKTLVILSPNALESVWPLLEVEQALEQSKKCNYLTLRILLHNVTDQHILHLKRGIFASLPSFKLDFTSPSWEQNLVDEINKEVPLHSILPVEGSLAHALVFSHYAGFLSYVLPVFKETISQSKIFKDERQRVSLKYYMLIPGTFKIYDSLETCDVQNRIWIEKGDPENPSMAFVRKHAGKDRHFNITIYKISKETEVGVESYYFFADLPNVLNAIYRMYTEGLSFVDTTFQLARFYYMMSEVINHAENVDCFDTVKLIAYNEERRSVQQALFEAVRQDVVDNLAQELNTTPLSEQQSIPELLTPAKDEASTEFDVTVACLPEDAETAYLIKEHFENKNMNVYLDKANTPVFHKQTARWHIFVISPHVLTNLKNPLLLRCIGVLHDGLCNNALNVLPVIKSIRPNDIPSFIKWVTLVDVRENNFCDKLLQTMRGGTVRMEHRLPSGDVATGLAWAYYINYLTITLLSKKTSADEGPDLNGRIKKFLQENGIQCGCIRKLFSILPKSCDTEHDLSELANDGLEDGKFVLEKVGRLDPVYQNTGGQLGRPFYLYVYRYTDHNTNQSVCFLAEYCTPGTCLHRMAHEYSFAGLQKGDMIEQGAKFVNMLIDIVNRDDVKKKLGDVSRLIELIYYDDMESTVSEPSVALREALCKHLIFPGQVSRHTAENRTEYDIIYGHDGPDAI